MKRLSLAKLSKVNLSKMQEQAIVGGSTGECICPYACSACYCTVTDAVGDFDFVMEKGLYKTANDTKNNY